MGIPVLGVEPAANVAAEAARRGIPTRVEFFGEESARAMRDEGWQRTCSWVIMSLLKFRT